MPSGPGSILVAVPPHEALGAVLVRSGVRWSDGAGEGDRIDKALARRLAAAGVSEVWAVRFGPHHLGRNEAAARVAAAPIAPGTGGVFARRVRAGRVDLHARHAGLLVPDRAAIDRANAVTEAIGIATLDDHAWVVGGERVATVGGVPSTLTGGSVDAVTASLGSGAVTVHPGLGLRVALVRTDASDGDPPLDDAGAATRDCIARRAPRRRVAVRARRGGARRRARGGGPGIDAGRPGRGRAVAGVVPRGRGAGRARTRSDAPARGGCATASRSSPAAGRCTPGSAGRT